MKSMKCVIMQVKIMPMHELAIPRHELAITSNISSIIHLSKKVVKSDLPKSTLLCSFF